MSNQLSIAAPTLRPCQCGRLPKLVAAENVDARSFSASIECVSCEAIYSLMYCYATPEQAESTVVSRWNGEPKTDES